MKHNKRTIRIGTRPSPLALRQAIEIHELLKVHHADFSAETIAIDTVGDKDKKTPLTRVDGSDFFTREIDEALIGGDIDCAVHSAKDLPLHIPQGLTIAAITKGIDNRDALVIRGQRLPRNARIGTSSARRTAEITRIGKDFRAFDIRGTIGERLALLDANVIDGLIVASAAMIRLGLTKRIYRYLDITTSPLQGRLAILVRSDRSDSAARFAAIDDRKNWGTVALVGSGPGAGDLITVRGMRRLAEADVVFHDELGTGEVLNMFPEKQMIYVGKRGRRSSIAQEDIHRAMIDAAYAGKKTVRLKGGDPFIFGRGGEEIEALRSARVDYEIVPGITSALAAASYAEVPLTMRGHSSSVLFATGRSNEGINVPKPDAAGTLVYYMAVETTRTIGHDLVAAGWRGETPVAVVTNASMRTQNVSQGNLAELADGKMHADSPALIIIGTTAGMMPHEGWFARRKNILMTGTNPGRYAHLGEIIHTPLIELVDPASYRNLDAAIRRLDTYDHLIFTSAHAVDFLFRRLSSLGGDVRRCAHIEIASVGAVTAEALMRHGIKPDITPTRASAAGLIDVFTERHVRGKRILIPRSNLAYDELPRTLKRMGNHVDAVIAYRNRMPPHPRTIDLAGINAIIFTSPSCARNFLKVYRRIPSHMEIMVLGDTTKKAIGRHYGTITIIP
ncbi:MAG: uroporphyrinogen-III C-methyltransferase [Spirochaetes bacterium]|nr:uroporphyrinogen-III C-methyltransferase [Spirochaetota bacterium]